ncbi:hypothetical protein TgHK011_006163 [Trichoderma gracile]|nr:hypothetical protein TgHK011_006163 [Trichoderma gracile]
MSPPSALQALRRGLFVAARVGDWGQRGGLLWPPWTAVAALQRSGVYYRIHDAVSDRHARSSTYCTNTTLLPPPETD